MSITLEISKYNENRESAGFQKMDFSTIDEAIANLEFMKMGYDHFKTGDSLMVRLKKGEKVHLIDYHSVVPINEIRKELEIAFPQILKDDEKLSLAKKYQHEYDKYIDKDKTSLVN